MSIELFNEAIKNEKNQEWDSAINLYEQTILKNPEHFESWLNLGAVYSKTLKNEKAIQCYEKAILLRKDTRAYYNLGLVYYKQKKIEHALKNFLICLENDPNFFPASLLLGYLYTEISRIDEAIQVVKNALEKNPQNESLLICLAIIYNAAEKFELSSTIIEHILQKKPDQPVALRLKARLSLNKPISAESIENFRKLLLDDPDCLSLETYIELPENKNIKFNILKSKSDLIKKNVKNSQDYFDLSLMSFLSGNANAAMNYLLFSVKNK